MSASSPSQYSIDTKNSGTRWRSIWRQREEKVESPSCCAAQDNQACLEGPGRLVRVFLAGHKLTERSTRFELAVAL